MRFENSFLTRTCKEIVASGEWVTQCDSISSFLAVVPLSQVSKKLDVRWFDIRLGTYIRLRGRRYIGFVAGRKLRRLWARTKGR